MKSCFRNWNFKKHLKFVSVFYGILYVIDLTLGYLLIKKIGSNQKNIKSS